MASQLRTEIAIQAGPERVWEVLTDFASYPDWNPFIPRISGPVEAGARLDARLQPPSGGGMRFQPRILEAGPGKTLRWLGHLGVPGLFDGEHGFRIEPRGAACVRLIQEERFSGLLAPIVFRMIERGTREGFEAMNLALKTRAEQPSSSH